MEVSCPISKERINETVVRLIASIVAVVAILCFVFDNYWAMFFLVIDFGIRAFKTGKFSLIRFLALQVFNLFKFSTKVTDLAPKKFAATIGFAFCSIISLFYSLGYSTIVLGLTIILFSFALLESVFAVCIGCYVYSFLQSFKSNK